MGVLGSGMSILRSITYSEWFSFAKTLAELGLTCSPVCTVRNSLI